MIDIHHNKMYYIVKTYSEGKNMYCKNCGREIDDCAYVCPHCGVKTGKENSDADSGSKAGWGILSFLIPIAGLVLFLVWKTERPKTAKVCGICALVAVIIEVVVAIIYGVLIGSKIGSMLSVVPYVF